MIEGSLYGILDNRTHGDHYELSTVLSMFVGLSVGWIDEIDDITVSRRKRSTNTVKVSVYGTRYSTEKWL